MDEAGADKARFVVSEAWPCKYDPSDLNGKGNEVVIELLELSTRASSGSSRAGEDTARAEQSEFQTEVEFTLPKGYLDATASCTATA